MQEQPSSPREDRSARVAASTLVGSQPNKTTVLLATAYTLGGRALGRVASFATTLAMAYFLAPRDFGLIASVLIFIDFAETVSQVGARDFLIQRPSLYRNIVRDAYAIELIRGGAIASILLLLSPLLVRVTGNGEHWLLFAFMSLAPFVASTENISLHLEMRKLNFRSQFLVDTVGPLCALALGLAAALLLQNVWALVVSKFAEIVGRSAFSHMILPTSAPRFPPRRPQLFAQFSTGVLVGAIVGYLAMNLPILTAITLFSTPIVGLFYMAFSLSNFAIAQFVKPTTKVIFTTLSKIRSDATLHRKTFHTSYALLVSCAAPIGAILIAASGDLERHLFASQWTGLGVYLAMFSIAAQFRLLVAAGGGVFWSLGRTDIPAAISTIHLITTLLGMASLTLIVGTSALTPVGLLTTWCITSALNVVVWLVYLEKTLPGASVEWLRYQTSTAASLLALSLTAWILPPAANLLDVVLRIAALSLVYAVTQSVLAFFSPIAPWRGVFTSVLEVFNSVRGSAKHNAT